MHEEPTWWILAPTSKAYRLLGNDWKPWGPAYLARGHTGSLRSPGPALPSELPGPPDGSVALRLQLVYAVSIQLKVIQFKYLQIPKCTKSNESPGLRRKGGTKFLGMFINMFFSDK